MSSHSHQSNPLPTTTIPPNPAHHAHPNPVAVQLAQLGITPAELDKLDQECMHEQTKLLVIEDKAW